MLKGITYFNHVIDGELKRGHVKAALPALVAPPPDIEMMCAGVDATHPLYGFAVRAIHSWQNRQCGSLRECMMP
ncbi:MAG: hypothetical protein OXG06_03625 [Gammaproteobacteria bacterium]|nr:hypothetical protein [Gammaproteobacteria bacterium]